MTAIAEDRQDLATLLREFEKVKREIASRVDRLHHLAQQIDRQATANGDAHIAMVVRGTTHHLSALGQGLSRMRSLRTAERTNAFRRDEEEREQKVRAAAKEALAARRAARQVVDVEDDE